MPKLELQAGQHLVPTDYSFCATTKKCLPKFLPTCATEQHMQTTAEHKDSQPPTKQTNRQPT